MALFTNTLTILRESGGYRKAGRWVAGTSQAIVIACSIQPPRSGSEAEVLPAGVNSNDVELVYTKTMIQGIDQVGEELADKTTIDGSIYIAMKVKNYSRQAINTAHYEVLFVRQTALKAGTRA